MTWLFITIASYFLNAGVYVADKFLLSKKFHSSITYAFYVGVWSILNFVILIFVPYVPSLKWLLIDILAGGVFLLTIIFWYKALHQSEATRVVPMVGVLTPIFTLLLSVLFLGENLSQQHFISFSVLMIGGALISVKQTKVYIFSSLVNRTRDVLGKVHVRYLPMQRLIINSTVSAFCFSAYYVLIKYIYSNEPFLGSFVWSRLGTFIGVLLILIVPSWRQSIADHQKNAENKTNVYFFLGVRIVAAAAFIMLNWAISLGNVAMVNVLQGAQYLFLIIFVLILSAKFPSIYKEELGRGVILQKIAGVVFVSWGLYILIS